MTLIVASRHLHPRHHSPRPADEAQEADDKRPFVLLRGGTALAQAAQAAQTPQFSACLSSTFGAAAVRPNDMRWRRSLLPEIRTVMGRQVMH